jgi:hypothetical protein
MADQSVVFTPVDPNVSAAAANITDGPISASDLSGQMRSNGSAASVQGQTSNVVANTTQTTLATHVKGPIPITQEASQAVPNDYYRFGYAAPNDDGLFLPPRSLVEQDEALVSIRLIASNSSNTNANNSSTTGTTSSYTGNQAVAQDLTTPFTHFFLESINEPHQERMAILETFTSSWIYFFGEQTPIFNYSGFLLNSDNHRWVNDWISIYDRAFRGTQAVQRQAIIQMAYDGRIIEGYICNQNLSRTAVQDKGYPFSFAMVITNIYITDFSDDFLPASDPDTKAITDYSAIFPPNSGTGPGLTSPGTNISGLSISSAQTAIAGGPTAQVLSVDQSLTAGLPTGLA